MIFILEADDKYILDKKVEELKEKYLGKVDEFNFYKFDITESMIIDITGSFLSNSMFDSKKMVIIENALFLTKKEKSKYIDEKNIPELFLLLEKMSNDNIVIFPLIDCVLNLNSEYLKGIKYEYIVCDKVGHDFRDYGEQLKVYNKYAKEICKNNNAKIEDEAYNLLISYWFPLYEFENEIKKLLNYSSIINLEGVQKLTTPPISDSVFKLIDFLFKDDKSESLKVFNELLLNNVEVIQVINTLASLLRFLYLVKYYLDEGFDAYEIADRLDGSVARVKKNIISAKNASLAGIRKVLFDLSNLDYEIKKGQVSDPIFTFSNFILNFNLK